LEKPPDHYQGQKHVDAKRREKSLLEGGGAITRGIADAKKVKMGKIEWKNWSYQQKTLKKDGGLRKVFVGAKRGMAEKKASAG